MLQITKIFRFEMAHAIYGYPGKCKDIHGHSYELHVTIAPTDISENFLPGPGLIMDFKELKQIVNEGLIRQLDHKLVLSDDFITAHSTLILKICWNGNTNHRQKIYWFTSGNFYLNTYRSIFV